jgi:site-specific DNA recombinase
MRKPDRPKSGQIFRCAIYTRKSSDDGLEQEFNSLAPAGFYLLLLSSWR